MCGRYSLDADIFAILNHYRLEERRAEFEARDELFPTDSAPVYPGGDTLRLMQWGFVESFSKRPLINARGESVADKVTFRTAFANGRCLIPATSFYEWKSEAGKKVKMKIAPEGLPLFSMAGIYKTVQGPNGPIDRYCILTIEASKQMSEIHHRMPVILTPAEERRYLEAPVGKAGLLQLLKPYSGSLSIQRA